MKVVVELLLLLLVHLLAGALLVSLQLDGEHDALLLEARQVADLDAGDRDVHLPQRQQRPLEVVADGEQLPLRRLAPEHRARPREGDRELLTNQRTVLRLLTNQRTVLPRTRVCGCSRPRCSAWTRRCDRSRSRRA